jgi:tetratricopeptide (TPR) repeat protein
MVHLRVIDQRFILESLAGRGGMGEVYRATDLQSGEPVAVKLLYGPHVEESARFLREASILRQFADPLVVRHIAHGVSEDGQPYLVMEWLNGMDLGSRLKNGRLGAAEAVRLCTQVADALAIIHKEGIVHRDLKPSNIFLLEGDTHRIKLLDFGTAHLESASRMTLTGMLLGTVGYMAPEQAKGSRQLDSRADIFSLGCVLFECLCGEPTFQSQQWMALLAKILFEATPQLSERCPNAPRDISVLLSSMLAKDPEERPKDGEKAAAALRALAPLSEEPLLTVGPPTQRPALTDSEQRAVAVLLVGPDGGAPLQSKELDWLSEQAAAFGASHEALANDSVAFVLWGAKFPTDLAAKGAALALSLAATLPRRNVALAIGRGALESELPLGATIEMAAELAQPADAEAHALICLDETSARLLDSRYEVVERGAHFELLRPRPVGEVRTLLGRLTPLVGRERELRMLTAQLRACIAEGSGAHVMLVSAPPGIGKSRLGNEFLAHAIAEFPHLSMMAARGEPFRAGSPLRLLSSLVCNAAGIRGGEPTPERTRLLWDRVARFVPLGEQPGTWEFLCELIGAPAQSGGSSWLRAARRDPALMTDRIQESFVAFLQHETAANPSLILLEDLHWGDNGSIQAIDRALAALQERPLFVLALARPEVHVAFPSIWSRHVVQELRLRELPEQAALRLVEHALGPKASPELRGKLVRLAEGNAFYLEELIRSAASSEEHALPETVVAMVQARLMSLPDVDRRILRAASILGETFWQGVVEDLVGHSTEAEGRLQQLVEREICQRNTTSRFGGEVEYSFRHALLREGAYALLTPEDRTLGHQLAATWLEGHGEEDALLLASHYARGGQGDSAAALYLRAAERASLAGDTAMALSCVERGLEQTSNPDLRQALLGASCQYHYFRADRVHLAADHAEELLRTAQAGGGPWAQAMLVRITIAAKNGDREVFGVSAAQVLNTQFLPGSYEAASLTLATICYLFEMSGHIVPANAAFAQLTKLAQDSGQDAPGVQVLHPLYGALRSAYANRDPYSGLLHSRVARERASLVGHRKYGAVAVLFGAVNAWLLGDIEGARTAAREADSFADESGYASATRPFLLAWLCADCGDFGEALHHAESLLSAGRSRGLPLDEARGHWVVAEVLRRTPGTPKERAQREAELAVAQLREVCPLDLPGALATLAAIELERGLVERAHALLQEALELEANMGAASQFFRSAFLRATHLAALQAAASVELANYAQRYAAWLDEIADKVLDSVLREAFRSRVPEHATIYDYATRLEREGVEQ